MGYIVPAAFWDAAPALAGGAAVVVAAAGGTGGHLIARRGRRLQNSSRLLTDADDAGAEWLLALAVQSLDDDTQTATATSDELGRLNGYDQ